MVLGEVVVETPDEVVAALLDLTAASLEDLVASLGGSVEEAAAALDIVEVRPAEAARHLATRPLMKPIPVRQRPFYINRT